MGLDSTISEHGWLSGLQVHIAGSCPAVGEDEARKPYKYDCLDSENVKPVSEIELKPEKSRVRTYEKNNYVDTKVIEDAWGGDALGTGPGIPLQVVVKTMVKQTVLL
ncbi:hypothetical protein DUI87_19133 [Hirundo rustica rustica]|uniref:Uncharacterized protein n=1 Tax=Hirundo rustica rustica TaxID=333673 RepID=A0A3M0JYV0_HIRRU|nr:hypothetical protein DUI87_19133 [Hirundo rustica rustica]